MEEVLPVVEKHLRAVLENAELRPRIVDAAPDVTVEAAV